MTEILLLDPDTCLTHFGVDEHSVLRRILAEKSR